MICEYGGREKEKMKKIKYEHIEKAITHNTLFTEKYNNYFVNGLLSGNRRSKIIKYKKQQLIITAVFTIY